MVQPRQKSRMGYGLSRRELLGAGSLGAAAALTGGLTCSRQEGPASPIHDSTPTPVGVDDFALSELSVLELQAAMESGQWTAHDITAMYLDRIEAVDRRGPELRSILEVNPEALAIADQLDRERESKGPRGPLHGIPVLLKDNIATADRMSTTAGSLALEGCTPPRDSEVAHRLREAGAILLGKTNLSEWIPTPWTETHVAPAPDPGQLPRRAWQASLSALRPTVPSSAHRTPMAWSGSNRRSVSSVGRGSFRFPTRRTPPAR